MSKKNDEEIKDWSYSKAFVPRSQGMMGTNRPPMPSMVNNGPNGPASRMPNPGQMGFDGPPNSMGMMNNVSQSSPGMGGQPSGSGSSPLLAEVERSVPNAGDLMHKVPNENLPSSSMHNDIKTEVKTEIKQEEGMDTSNIKTEVKTENKSEIKHEEGMDTGDIKTEVKTEDGIKKEIKTQTEVSNSDAAKNVLKPSPEEGLAIVQEYNKIKDNIESPIEEKFKYLKQKNA